MVAESAASPHRHARPCSGATLGLLPNNTHLHQRFKVKLLAEIDSTVSTWGGTTLSSCLNGRLCGLWRRLPREPGVQQTSASRGKRDQAAPDATARYWPFRGFPLAPYLVSFPCFLLVSLQHPLVSSGNPGETPWNSSFWGGSEPCLRLFWGQNRQNTGYFAGIPGCLENPGIPGKYLGIVPISSILPQILPQTSSQTQGTGKLASFPRETREKQNGAPNTVWFPWKLPETQSAGERVTDKVL